ncbi:MAG: MoxR family ATPase [Nanoarchaeota archaeon]
MENVENNGSFSLNNSIQSNKNNNFNQQINQQNNNYSTYNLSYYRQKIKDFFDLMNKIILGQEDTIKKIFIAVLTSNHVLVEGAPGLAKTKMIKTLQKLTSLKFSRIQFTPDLLPSDILGYEIFKDGRFIVRKGPIFANLVLADEINRAPPKTQSALLEAMAEKQVTIGTRIFRLDRPFFVMATQNPIEQEGTFPLPEAQLDRFMFKLIVNYPSYEIERKILDLVEEEEKIELREIFNKNEILELQKLVKNIYVDKKIKDLIAFIVTRTRESEILEYGASPRATISFLLASKAKAFIEGRDFVIPEDIFYIFDDILRHRIKIKEEYELEGWTINKYLKKLRKEAEKKIKNLY